MVNTIYADCFSGISGDMFLAALLNAGLPMDYLREQLAQLGLTGFTIESEETKEASAINASRLLITLPGKQPHRDWQTIKGIIKESSLSQPVKDRALAIFTVLAKAEAKVHGCPLDKVHFHEVGGLDSILDIVGAAIGLDYFSITNLTVSPLPMGRGWVKCQHGMLPLPAPAVSEILHGVPIKGIDLEQELVTPTGAAIVKAMATSFGMMPTMISSATGYGAGTMKRQDGRPNLLRLILGRMEMVNEDQEVEVIETNLDDWSPETYPYVCERLLAHGALDVSLIPVQMKKGRPGFTIRVIGTAANSFDLKNILLSETSAIGLRYRRENRMTLPRTHGTVPTVWGRLEAKKTESPTGPSITPEYEDCRRLSRLHGVSIKEVYRQAGLCPLEDFIENPKA